MLLPQMQEINCYLLPHIWPLVLWPDQGLLIPPRPRAPRKGLPYRLEHFLKNRGCLPQSTGMCVHRIKRLTKAVSTDFGPSAQRIRHVEWHNTDTCWQRLDYIASLYDMNYSHFQSGGGGLSLELGENDARQLQILCPVDFNGRFTYFTRNASTTVITLPSPEVLRSVFQELHSRCEPPGGWSREQCWCFGAGLL